MTDAEYRDAEARIWAECRREIRSALVAWELATKDVFAQMGREHQEALDAIKQKWTPVLEPINRELSCQRAEARSKRDARLELLKRGEAVR